jgi:DNA polymerase I
MHRLVLIDGNAILHRAYHAIPRLTAPDGSVVNAVYGFATMLFKIFQNLQPTHMAVAFDRPAPTFRKKLFKGYQSKRPKMDDDLASQIERVHKLVEVFGIPIFEKDGFEADDVIGTLATHVKGIDQVIIVTGDRDILQLVVDQKILVYMPTKGLSEGKIYSEKDVVERLGVTPKQIADFKGLAGDASDNYPGVEGIGPKTAVDLLTQYQTLKGVYENLSKVKEGVAVKLKAGQESANLSYELATIRTDVPIDSTLTQTTNFDSPQARAFLESMHFHSLLKRLNGGKPHFAEASRGKEEEPKESKKKPGEQQELF